MIDNRASGKGGGVLMDDKRKKRMDGKSHSKGN